ncbi:hypothetical protein M7775_02140 [Sporomusa sphaeroides DSM 2875]|uniref:hypothetical protein n=1 Tax=Sporomusa sphaeroides TaxID=47679 RepID=UPI002030F9EF|nr:hypothetical protein [Sporomusa sphaeroides]MCM0757368.1 hypothetical protein [Sporomusa sphaeroides DSM 2875]
MQTLRQADRARQQSLLPALGVCLHPLRLGRFYQASVGITQRDLAGPDYVRA